MLKKIKSSYFVNKIFTYIDEKQKLNVVKYNKKLQKNVKISIINYKHFSGKYIIYESDGNVKKYNGHNDTLLFEGKLKGRGKEYYENGKLSFEGDFFEWKKKWKRKRILL